MAAGPLLGLDADTWARLSPLLDAALDLAPAERGAWLERLPADCADLENALRRLIAGGEGTGRLHDQAPLDASATGATAAPLRRAGDVVGGYRLISELGSGGMGVVWLAERADGLLQRQVALKLPRTGGLPGDLAARMAGERDILAALVHPNIARLYDAGIGADGQPFLALEYVEGERIDAFARRHRLDTVGRLRLFLQAARAVAYAHAQLVVHRDLKPSNLLVDGQRQVKLLDFGIAKLLDHDAAPPSELTERGGKVMTPGYASPEQVGGLPVGTRSDVYSLGVVLYELLAGTGPYRPRRDSRAALEDAVLHEEPRCPSDAADAQLRRELHGDLDTIVLHALKKSPDDRYATVDALAEDIERHLEHRPVLARPDSLRYTLGRLVRRNRLAFGAAGAVMLAVVAGAGTAIWQGRVAVAERQRADQVKEFVATMLREANTYEAGDVGKLSAVDLVRQARKRLDEAAISQPEVRAELATLIGESLLSLGDVEAAEPVLERAAAEARRALGDSHPQTLRARLLMSQVGRLRGRAAEQRAEFAALLPLLRARAAEEPALLVVGLQHLTLTAIDQGDYVQAERAAVEGAQLAQARLGERHQETVASAVLLGMAHVYTKNHDAALPAAERGLQLTLQVYPGPGLHPRTVEARAMFGRALANVGRLQEGVAELQAAVSEAQALYGPSGPVVGVLRQNLVAYRIDLGQLAAADADSAEALRIVALNAAAESYAHAGTAAARGAVLLALRRPADALAILEPAVATLGRVIGEGHDATLAARALLALALAGVGRLDAAATTLSAVAERSAGPGVSAATRARLAYAQAVVDRLAGRPADAVRRLQPVLADANPAPRLQRERARARVELGLAHLALGQRGDAVASFETALSELTRLETEPTPTRAEALAGLGRARTP